MAELLVVILHVHHHGRADLLEIVPARRGARRFASTGEDREEDRGQDGDDGDHNK
jgi:hypothetical protein